MARHRTAARPGHGSRDLRRDRRRRRAQRAGRRGLPGPVRAHARWSWRARHKTGGAATTEAPWPDAPEFQVTRLSYVMSLLPPTIIKDLDLARHGYKIYPMGPYYQAFPEGGSIKLYADDAKRNHEEVSKWSKKDADAMPRWDAWLAGLADVLGPLLLTVPPNIGSRKPRDLTRDAAAGLAEPRPGRAHDRRRHPAHDDEHRRPARRLVRVAAGQGRARGQRRDRHLGRPVRAGHRVRDGAPLDRRRGRRPPRQLGLPGRRHGRGVQRDRVAPPASTAPRSGPTRRWPGSWSSGGRAAGVVLENGEEIRARVVVSTLHPRTAFLDQSAGSTCRGDFVSDIEHWKTRSGVVKINLALAELPDFTADPGTNLQEHHTGSVEMAPTMEYIERAFQDAREGRPAQRPFSDGVIPTAFDKTLSPEGTHIMSLFTQWVPADWSERAAHRGTRGLRRPDDRLLQRAGAQPQGVHPAPRHRRPLRDGARLRAGRRQHLPRGAVPGAAVPHAPRARLRRLPHARSPACTTAARPRTRAAGCAASPAGRRPRRRSRTRRAQAGRAGSS